MGLVWIYQFKRAIFYFFSQLILNLELWAIIGHLFQQVPCIVNMTEVRGFCWCTNRGRKFAISNCTGLLQTLRQFIFRMLVFKSKLIQANNRPQTVHWPTHWNYIICPKGLLSKFCSVAIFWKMYSLPIFDENLSNKGNTFSTMKNLQVLGCSLSCTFHT